MKGKKKVPAIRLSESAEQTLRQLDTLRDENDALRTMLADIRAGAARLEEQIGALERENEKMSRGYLAVEQSTFRLYSLYAASQRLHESYERHEVLKGIEEIAAAFIGCEELAVYELDSERGALALSGTVGTTPEPEIPLGRGPVGQAVAAGKTFLASAPAASPGQITACIPLKVGPTAVGAIVLFRLLPHKTLLAPEDREMFDLLATQAGVALHCARLQERRRGARAHA